VPSPAPNRDGARSERGIALDRAGTTEGWRRVETHSGNNAFVA